ncbi:MAG: hypothetical protein PHI94_05700 [Eubacteriaceae bacterium]|nr:hypothetical protein [Eubacteriaceae bacterium]
MQAIMETLFDIFYLSSVIILGIRMIRGAKNSKQYQLFGIMAVVLGCGDAFHLVPRAVALCTTGLASYAAPLGIGKLITSITMTLFYVLLYLIWRERYKITGEKGLTTAVVILAVLRIVLCLMPQNAWTQVNAPVSWGIYRNIPFAILGLVIVVLFYRKRQDTPFKWLWVAIIISFTCYIPVVLWAEAVPLVGILMIPKTCAYLWMVVMGYQAMKKEIPHAA